jgi:hypothetical protein
LDPRERPQRAERHLLEFFDLCHQGPHRRSGHPAEALQTIDPARDHRQPPRAAFPFIKGWFTLSPAVRKRLQGGL